MFKRIPALIGISGVSPLENARARFWAGVMEIPLLLIALWLLLTWYIEVARHKPQHLHKIEDWLVWCFFLGETLLLTILVGNKKRYLKDNWLNLLIIVAGIPIAFGNTAYATELRLLRILLIFSIIIHLMIPVRNLLARNHFGVTLAIATVVITFVGILAAGIDPGIGSVDDGIWWAWVTATTVGYGDIVPVTIPGRLLAGALIVGGLCLFSLITANISAFLISRNEEEELETRLDRIESALNRIERQLQQRDENCGE
jgi:voltage-gated potassium channel